MSPGKPGTFWPLSTSPCLRKKTAGWFLNVVHGVRDAGIHTGTPGADQSSTWLVVLFLKKKLISLPLLMRKSKTSYRRG